MPSVIKPFSMPFEASPSSSAILQDLMSEDGALQMARSSTSTTTTTRTCHVVESASRITTITNNSNSNNNNLSIVADQMVDRCESAAKLMEIGAAHASKKSYSAAVDCWSEAVDLYQDCIDAATSVVEVGTNAGQSPKAAAITIPEPGTPGAVCLEEKMSLALQGIAEVHATCNDLDAAVDCHERIVTLLLGLLEDTTHTDLDTSPRISSVHSGENKNKNNNNNNNISNNHSEDEAQQQQQIIATICKLDDHKRVQLLFQSLNQLGQLYIEGGNEEEALGAHEEALDLLRCMPRTLQVQSNMAETLYSLGTVYLDKGDTDRAYHSMQEALGIRLEIMQQQQEDETHNPDVLSAFSKLGVIHEKRGELDDALECFERVLLARSEQLHEDHVDVAESLEMMARVMQQQGNWDGALDLFHEGLRIYKKREEKGDVIMGHDIVRLLISTGSVYRQKGEIDEALAVYRDALCRQMELKGENHVDVARLQQIIGSAHLENRSLVSARLCFNEALRLYELNSVPQNDSNVMVTRKSLQAIHRSERGDSSDETVIGACSPFNSGAYRRFLGRKNAAVHAETPVISNRKASLSSSATGKPRRTQQAKRIARPQRRKLPKPKLKYVAIRDFKGGTNQLSIKMDDVIIVEAGQKGDWWWGTTQDGFQGWFPEMYVAMKTESAEDDGAELTDSDSGAEQVLGDLRANRRKRADPAARHLSKQRSGSLSESKEIDLFAGSNNNNEQDGGNVDLDKVLGRMSVVHCEMDNLDGAKSFSEVKKEETKGSPLSRQKAKRGGGIDNLQTIHHLEQVAARRKLEESKDEWIKNARQESHLNLLDSEQASAVSQSPRSYDKEYPFGDDRQRLPSFSRVEPKDDVSVRGPNDMRYVSIQSAASEISQITFRSDDLITTVSDDQGESDWWWVPANEDDCGGLIPVVNKALGTLVEAEDDKLDSVLKITQDVEDSGDDSSDPLQNVGKNIEETKEEKIRRQDEADVGIERALSPVPDDSSMPSVEGVELCDISVELPSPVAGEHTKDSNRDTTPANDELLGKMSVVHCEMDEQERAKPFAEVLKTGEGTDVVSTTPHGDPPLRLPKNLSTRATGALDDVGRSPKPKRSRPNTPRAQSEQETRRKSIDILTEALQAQRKTDKTGKEVSRILTTLADLCRAERKLDKSLKYALEAVKLRKKAYGELHPTYAKSLNSAGKTYLELGEFEAAMTHHQNAYKVLYGCYGEDRTRTEVSDTLINIGSVYYKERNSVKTIRAHGDSYNNFSESGMLETIACAHEDRGNYSMATMFFEERLHLLKSRGKPELRKDIALTLNSLGRLKRKKASFGEALEMHDQALRLQKNASCSQLDMANTWVLQGSAHFAVGNFLRALTLLQGAIPVQERALGKDNSRLAATLVQVGVVQLELWQLTNAANVLNRALMIQKKVLGKDHPDTLVTQMHMGSLLHMKGKIEEATKLFSKIVHAQRLLYGDKHPCVAETLHKLGIVQARKGDTPAAFKSYQECYHIQQSILGEEHPALAATLHSIAAIHSGNKRYKKALRIYEQVVSCRKEMLGEKHVEVAKSILKQGVCFAAQSNLTEAMKLYDEALVIAQNAVGKSHPLVADIFVNIGDVHLRKCEFDFAKKNLDAAIKIYKESGLDNKHPKLRTALEGVSRVDREEELCV